MKTIIFVLAMLLVIPMTTAAAPPKKPRKVKRSPKAAKPEWLPVRKILRRVERITAGDVQVVEYPGVVLVKKYRRRSETMVVLADCAEEQVCIYKGGCVFDHDWHYVAPGTNGEFWVRYACAN